LGDLKRRLCRIILRTAHSRASEARRQQGECNWADQENQATPGHDRSFPPAVLSRGLQQQLLDSFFFYRSQGFACAQSIFIKRHLSN
jgi:hypothetical protein